MDHKKVKNFQSQIWKIHHEGQPMPSQSDDADKSTEDADLIMSQVNIWITFNLYFKTMTPFKGLFHEVCSTRAQH